jgi:hypothetical protein
MKQKAFRGIRKGKKSMAAIQQPKKSGPLPPRWWLGKEANAQRTRDDERAWLDW